MHTGPECGVSPARGVGREVHASMTVPSLSDAVGELTLD
jgi:hypothetical protein